MDITAQEIQLAELHESPWNPRKHFPQKGLDELASSIKKVGILSPLLVRPSTPTGRLAVDGYEIAAGHRRYRAAKLAKLAQIPCIVRPMADQEFLEILTIENLQREDVHPLDEAEGYRTLMKQAGWDVETISAKVGKSLSYVYQRLKLAELIEPAKKAFLEEKITAGHAILIARLQPKDQAAAMKQIFDIDGYGYMRRAEGEDARTACSVRDLARWIEHEVHLDIHAAPWKKDDATLVPAAGPCTTCPKRSGFTPALFPDLAKKDVCLDRTCFAEKHEAHTARLRAEYEAKGEKLLELSTSYSRGRKESLPRRQWGEQAVKPKSCPSVRAGIVVDGDHEYKTGQVLHVCPDAKCKVHRPHHAMLRAGAGDGSSRAAQEKARVQQAVRTGIHAALRAKVRAPLPPAMLRLVALSFFQDIWHEHQVTIARAWAWGDAKKARMRLSDGALGKRLASLSPQDLARFLVDLAVARSLHASYYNFGGRSELLAAAKHYQVNTGKIERAVKTEAAAKQEAARAKAKGRAKAGAKKGAKPKAGWKLFPVPTCTHCACTEAAACQGGCSWVKLDKTTNAGVCSRCAPVKQAAKKAGKRKAPPSAARTPVQTAAKQVG